MSKRAVELGKFERGQGGNKVSELTFEHQGEKIAADRACAWHAVFRPQYDFGRESEDLPINRSTDDSRHIFMFGDKCPRYYDVKTGFGAALRNSFACTVDFPAPHERACSEMSARAWRARRLRFLRNTAPSFESLSLRRSRAAYWRNAVRSNAARLFRRAEPWANSSSSFTVASSTAMVFIWESISVLGDSAQGLRDLQHASAAKAIR